MIVFEWFDVINGISGRFRKDITVITVRLIGQLTLANNSRF